MIENIVRFHSVTLNGLVINPLPRNGQIPLSVTKWIFGRPLKQAGVEGNFYGQINVRKQGCSINLYHVNKSDKNHKQIKLEN